jgi:anti-sigma factor RsiW
LGVHLTAMGGFELDRRDVSEFAVKERRVVERQLGRKPANRTHTAAEIRALVRQLKDIVAVLADADPADKRAVYDELGST